jgi:hypothetical protein
LHNGVESFMMVLMKETATKGYKMRTISQEKTKPMKFDLTEENWREIEKTKTTFTFDISITVELLENQPNRAREIFEEAVNNLHKELSGQPDTLTTGWTLKGDSIDG